MRPYLSSSDPNLVVTAAAALASSDAEPDVRAAEATFKRFTADTREAVAPVRREVARALGLVRNPRFRPLLVPLMYDENYLVARAAIASAGTIGGHDFLYVPTLVAVMRNRRLTEPARQVLVGYGDDVVDPLSYFMLDKDEDIWVRRHVPGTLAHIPTVSSVEALISALDDVDGFLHYKAIAALGRIRRDRPEIVVNPVPVERHVQLEAARAFEALTLYANLFVSGGVRPTCLLARAIEERRKRAMSRMFRLLGLIYPPADIAAVQAGLARSDARGRSAAVEYLDNLLRGDVRRRVMLLVEDMPADERLRKGNVLYRTRARNVEDTMAQLLHFDNQVVAAAAIHLVEEQAWWQHAGDLEHILAHRDARDWYVFEAASWALAARRMPTERRRELWREPLPAVELANRLRKLTIFEFTSVDQLCRIAGLGRQVRYEDGQTLYQRGTLPDCVQFLLDGQVKLAPAGGADSTFDAPGPLGFEEVLEGRPMHVGVRACGRAICLSLTTEELLSLLAENVALAEGIFRWLIESRSRPSWQTVVKGELTPDARRKVAGGLQPVDRVLLLQSSPLLAHATGAQLLRLAAIARPVTVRAGHDPFAAQPEPSILIVLTGTLTLTPTAPSDSPVTAGAGDVIGMYETLGGAPLGAEVVASSDVTALRMSRSEIFELLADETSLLQGIFSGLMHGEATTAA
jgi:CRP-like cAMP-binding protein/HEAT repeat protein